MTIENLGLTVRFVPVDSTVSYPKEEHFPVLLTTPSPKLKSPVWNFKVPKKVKFFLWCLFYRSLNTSDRLQWRFPHWALPLQFVGWALLCKIGESYFHSLSFCRQSVVFCTIGIGSFSSSPSKNRWFVLECFGGVHLRGKSFVLCNYAVRALLWLICKERNSRHFEDKKSLGDSFGLNVQHIASWWTKYHNNFFNNYSMIVNGWKTFVV